MFFIYSNRNVTFYPTTCSGILVTTALVTIFCRDKILQLEISQILYITNNVENFIKILLKFKITATNRLINLLRLQKLMVIVN